MRSLRSGRFPHLHAHFDVAWLGFAAGLAAHNLKLRRGVLRAPFRDGIDDDVRGRNNVDAHDRAALFIEPRKLAGCRVNFCHRFRDAFAVEASRFGKANAAALGLKKLHAQFALEPTNCLGERGLRYAKLLGAVRDMLAARHFQEIPQLQKLHSASLLFLNHNIKVMIDKQFIY